MNNPYPIFTELIRCQDCYKCVRECPVKAIQVVNDSAMILSERCIYCGNCANICPVGAKKVRDDLSRAKLLIRRKERVVVSLAPSFVTEFPGVNPGSLIRALKLLGFWAVSETALGAEQVSAACSEALRNSKPGLTISSTCPTVVELVRRYYPELQPNLSPIMSPLQAHGVLLRETYGEDIGVVFIGPCISKKLESDAKPDRIHVALTFKELRRWLEDRGIDPTYETALPEDVFVPRSAAEGALYPIDGGMNRGIEARYTEGDVHFMAFSGVEHIKHAIEGLKGPVLDRKIFLELLACEGGCVNGPETRHYCGTTLRNLQVLDYAKDTQVREYVPSYKINREFESVEMPHTDHDVAAINASLRRLGKSIQEDELNCGGCGYDTCRKLAAAMLDGRAEPNMCVSYMRKLALNKANALIRAMPSGAVIVDENLNIVDCNRKFAEILGGETLTVYEAKPGMEGADLRKVVSFHNLFARVLRGDTESVRKDLRQEGLILQVTIFPIEAGHLVGGILQDITEPAVQRERIMQQAQDVIRKNLTTVQQIAYLLGENAADTELMLNGIMNSYRISTPNDPARSELARKDTFHG